MTKDTLNAENYYDQYKGWDLNLMYERVKAMGLPQDISERMRENLRLVLLGSATTNNFNAISKIDSYLHPGKVEQDEVVIVDRNAYTLAKHQKYARWIEEGDDWSPGPKSSPEFPYPAFHLVQADIRALPFAEHSIDVMVSDYTFNYLSTVEDVDRTFAEIARSLTNGGICIQSVRGNKHYPFSGKGESADIPDDLQTMDQGGVTIHCFPLQTYLRLAEKNGLQMVRYDAVGTDFCMLLKNNDRKILEQKDL